MEGPITGQCGCGAVRYRALAEPQMALICQCRDCQFDSGTGHSCHLMLPAKAVSFSGSLTTYHSTANSGNAVERRFCPTCGSPISYWSAAFANSVFVTAGSLDDPTIFKPAMIVYTASAQPWDTVDARLAKYDRMPPQSSDELTGGHPAVAKTRRDAV